MMWSPMYITENTLQCNVEESVNKTCIQYLNNLSSPKTDLNYVFIFKHILVQAKKQDCFTPRFVSKFSNEMIYKVYVLLIRRVNLRIFHRLLILKFVSKPQLDPFVWVTGSVVNT